MTIYKTTRWVSAEDAAYIAGLIDGEGTITLTRKHRNENRQLAVTISSTEKNLLDFVLNSTAVGKITNKRISQPQHKPSFTYALYNREALRLLQQIQPQLKSYKLARSALVLRDYVDVTPRNGKRGGVRSLIYDGVSVDPGDAQLSRPLRLELACCKGDSEIAIIINQRP